MYGPGLSGTHMPGYDAQRQKTSADCGGDTCTGCRPGERCLQGPDCDSFVCTEELCAAPRCDDAVRNGNETDQDCGGPDCATCRDGAGCVVASDCTWCVQRRRGQAPACDDGVHDEIGVDCGVCGTCACAAWVRDINDVGQFEDRLGDGAGDHDAGCGTSEGAAEVVHRIRFDRDRIVCVQTAGSDVEDTLIYVRSSCDEPDTELVCSDSVDYPADRTSALEFMARADTDYYLFVDQYGGQFREEEPAAGDYVLTVSEGRCGGEPLCAGDADCVDDNHVCDLDCVFEAPVCDQPGDCPQVGAVSMVFAETSSNSPAMVTWHAVRSVAALTRRSYHHPQCRPDRVVDIEPNVPVEGTTASAIASYRGFWLPGASPERAYRLTADEAGIQCVSVKGSTEEPLLYMRFEACQAGFVTCEPPGRASLDDIPKPRGPRFARLRFCRWHRSGRAG